MTSLHPKLVGADRAQLRATFTSADPFPHIVLDDAIAPAVLDELVATFPDDAWEGWDRFTDSYQAGKRYCQDIAAMPAAHARVINELTQPAFLDLLRDITGIDGLIPDPYLEGGGLHSSGAGGVLTPHTDFHLYTRLGLHRQLNLLLYLNQDWKPGDGGRLGLWRKGEEEPRVRVAPELGRVVIFRTADDSVHGFADPVAEGRERHSIALYYYTAAESEAYAGDTTTYWQQHRATSVVARIRLRIYQALLLTARGFAMLAHRANPNLTRRRPHR
ncbi:MAG TPA: 2OG-Fe(II) oxygenase [Mycobacteriales bacterium]|nr:2OG-Fe(II) oxygenase [Mycobacteriales bacterium]